MTRQAMSDISPFKIEIGDHEVEDLRRRLRTTRWPGAETVDDWSQGVPLRYLQDLCHFWAEEYDFDAALARLNTFPQFRTVIDGLGIHFTHARSPHPDALPLVITHGWPGSVAEFHKVVRPLTDPTAHGGDPSDAFHVVCPSLPGYGFSDKPTESGWGVERIAAAWDTLMGRLGYEVYGAQGGDWGARVATQLALLAPHHLAGIHLNMLVITPERVNWDTLTEDEERALATLKEFRRWDSGYAKQQSTRPQTLGYGLVDSPAGQLAWIVEKFRSWMDCDGDPTYVLTRDEILDNVMLYWLPATAASSARLYWESLGDIDPRPVEVPTGYSRFPKELLLASRRWAATRYPNITFWNELERGGHFPAWEDPVTFVDEVRSFFRQVRNGA